MESAESNGNVQIQTLLPTELAPELPTTLVPQEVEPELVEDIADNVPELANAENDNNINQSVTSEQLEESETSKLDSTIDESVVDPSTDPIVDNDAEDVPKPKPKEEEIDPNQCRICLVKKDLIDIFMIEERLSFSEKIVLLCPSIKILKNDYLPHFICETCLTNLKIAYNFKLLCEQTDKELRQKLKRGKKKAVRRPTEFVMIDAGLSDSHSEDEKKLDDEEFHISGSLSEAVSSDSSDSSYTTSKKKRPTRQRRKTSTSRKKSTSSNNNSRSSTRKRGSTVASSSASKSKLSKKKEEPSKRPRREIVLIKAVDSDEDDDVPLNQRIKTITNVDITTITGAPKKPSEVGTKPHGQY